METIEVKGDKEYEVKLTGFELVKITSLIEELPYKEANPLVKKIQEQIKQQTDANMCLGSISCRDNTPKSVHRIRLN